MAEAGPGALRYKAFLSYSHKDAAVAARLHRRLESYRLPRRLVGSEGARGPVPERLWPIFRDREELPAATDLSETVRAALAESASLIVLCSPNAAASLWVAEEIETFRRLYPERPILAAIVAGEPGECFPSALRAFGQDGIWHEPLATDLRPQGDGPHLGLLKLVAGITGVGLDALVQRDAQRKVRRVTAVTVTALLALLLMTGLTVFALDARAEAERQRAEAEGLIEFMLTDLRERLRWVGRLDVMRPVNERALDYFDRQSPEQDSLSGATWRARIHHAIGEDLLAGSKFDEAIAHFAEAYRITAAILDAHPREPLAIFAHAQSDYWVGRVHELRENWSAAWRQFTRYASAAQRLIEIDPGNPDYMMEVAWSHQNLGSVRLNGFDDADGAEEYYETAVEWFQRADRARPANDTIRRELANAYAWLADSYYVRQEWRQSLSARFRQYEITQALFDSAGEGPDNMELLYRLAIAERSVAHLSALTHNPRVAREFMLRAYRSAERLTARDPENAEWLLFRTKVECDLLSASLGVEADIARARLRESVAAAGVRLRSRGDPRVVEVARCLATHT